ncbi:unnamed protein product [Boreogadus saida]
MALASSTTEARQHSFKKTAGDERRPGYNPREAVGQSAEPRKAPRDPCQPQSVWCAGGLGFRPAQLPLPFILNMFVQMSQVL